MSITSITRAAFAALLVAGVALPASAQGKSKGDEKKNEKPVAKAVKAEDKREDKAVKAAEKRDEKVVVKTSRGDVASTLKSKNRSAKAKGVANGPKQVTSSQAVIVTRDVLVANGYQIVNVVPNGTTQVIYYRRGNRGNGRGLGPVEKIYVVPSGSVVRFQSVPEPLLATILRRLGM